jgi:hypothetical protein
VTISIRTSKKWINIVLFFIAVTPLCNRFGWEIIAYETFSPEGIAIFVTIRPGLLTTSFADTSPSPARVQIATALFVPE